MAREYKEKIKKAVTKSINHKNHTVDVIMSDETLDRDGEIILIDSWGKYLERFMTHPVLLDNHRMGSNLDILGKYASAEIVRGQGLFAKAEYFVEDEIKNTPNKETVRWAWVLVTNDLGAYSVRFIPHKWINREDFKEAGGMLQDSVIAQNPYRVYTEVELVECSQVTVPSNPSALLREMGEYEAEGKAEQFAIAKGVFDQRLLTMPKKSFYIGGQKWEESRGSIFLKVEFEGEEPEDYEKFLKSLKVTEVTEKDDGAGEIPVTYLDETEGTEGDVEDVLTGLEEEEQKGVEADEVDLETVALLKGLSVTLDTVPGDEEQVTEEDIKRLVNVLGLQEGVEEEVVQESEDFDMSEEAKALIKQALDITADVR